MGNRAKAFADKAVRLSRNRTELAWEGEAVANRVLECARRVLDLDPRAVSDADRELYLSRIYNAYEVVSAYLDSNAPFDLGCPEVGFGSCIHGVDTDGGYYSDDWDGCPGQVEADRVYEGA